MQEFSKSGLKQGWCSSDPEKFVPPKEFTSSLVINGVRAKNKPLSVITFRV
jgi:hypothetical protein